MLAKIKHFLLVRSFFVLLGFANGERRVSELSLPIYPMLGDRAIDKLTSQEIRTQFSRQTDLYPEKFKLITYATQEVRDGINYFAKMQIGSTDYVHMRVFQPKQSQLPAQLVAFILNMQIDDPLVYFLTSGMRTFATRPPPQQTSPGSYMLMLAPVATVSLGPFVSKRRTIPTTPVPPSTTVEPPEEDDDWPPPLENNFIVFNPHVQENYKNEIETSTTTLATEAPPAPPPPAAPADIFIPDNVDAASLSNEKPANDDIRHMLYLVKTDYMAKTNTNPTFFQLVSFRTQAVGDGTTYFMKVYVNYNVWDHLRLFVRSSYPTTKPILVGIRSKHGLFDTIEYFDGDTAVPLAPADNSDNGENGNKPAELPPPVEQPPQSVQTQPCQLSPLSVANDMTSSLINSVKPEFIRRSGIVPAAYQATYFRSTKSLAGVIYFVKVLIGVNIYVHLRIVLPADSTRPAYLQGYELNKKKSDSIACFVATFAVAPEPAGSGSAQPQQPQPQPQKQFVYDDLSPEIRATQDIQTLLQAIKPQFAQKVFDPQLFEGQTYRMKLVAGELYFVKVKLSVGEFAHLRIFKPLPYSTDRSMLETWDLHKAFDDPLVYFGPTYEPMVPSPGLQFQNVRDDADLNQFVMVTPRGILRTVRTTTARYLLPSADEAGTENSPIGVSGTGVLSGGLSATIPATTATRDMVSAVKPDFLRQSVFKPPMFSAIGERIQQANSGLIHFVKVQMNTASYVHLKIRSREGAPPELITFDVGKSLSDRIDFF